MGDVFVVVWAGVDATVDGQQDGGFFLWLQLNAIGVFGVEPGVEAVDAFRQKCPVLYFCLDGLVVLRV